MNKQNITKDTEIDNRLTVTRGGRGGNFREKGEGLPGTIIKDTWTIMGREVETGEGGGEGWGIGLRWGEKAENCT